MIVWLSIQALLHVQLALAHESFHDIVKYVNSLNTTWTAGHNFDPDLFMPKDLKFLCGAKLRDSNAKANFSRRKKIRSDFGSMPLLFDGREHWINCPSIGQVFDQGACSSSWAVSAVQAMTDRLCVNSEGRIITQLSAQDLLSCCGPLCGFGCEAGYPLEAWKYWRYDGIATGFVYGDQKYCQPYSFPPCEHGIHGKLKECNGTQNTPKCYNACRGNKTLDYAKSKYFAEEAYEVDSDVATIQMEIFKNGPVQATMSVYADFFTYKGGVYKHVTGEFIGGQAVRIIGWGQMDGSRYWTVANTWNKEWGDCGFFLIKRGNNACGIEESVVAGRPRVDDLFAVDRSKQEDVVF